MSSNTDFTKDSLIDLFDLIAESYGKQFKRPQKTAGFWLEGLSKYSKEEVVNAYETHLKQSDFPPQLCDLVKICSEGREHRRKRIEKIISEVRYTAARAVNDYPSNGEEERERAKKLFVKRCFATNNPVKSAEQLENYLDSLRVGAENINELINVDEAIEGVKLC